MNWIYEFFNIQPPDEDFTSTLIELTKTEIDRQPSEITFVKIIYKAFSISEENINKNRKRKYVQPRQVHMYVRHLFFKQKSRVAGSVYQKDHATVLHAVKHINNLLETEREFRELTLPIWMYWQSFNEPFPCEFPVKMVELIRESII